MVTSATSRGARGTVLRSPPSCRHVDACAPSLGHRRARRPRRRTALAPRPAARRPRPHVPAPRPDVGPPAGRSPALPPAPAAPRARLGHARRRRDRGRRAALADRRPGAPAPTDQEATSPGETAAPATTAPPSTTPSVTEAPISGTTTTVPGTSWTWDPVEQVDRDAPTRGRCSPRVASTCTRPLRATAPTGSACPTGSPASRAPTCPSEGGSPGTHRGVGRRPGRARRGPVRAAGDRRGRVGRPGRRPRRTVIGRLSGRPTPTRPPSAGAVRYPGGGASPSAKRHRVARCVNWSPASMTAITVRGRMVSSGLASGSGNPSPYLAR
jgi:hypothetical protein